MTKRSVLAQHVVLVHVDDPGVLVTADARNNVIAHDPERGSQLNAVSRVQLVQVRKGRAIQTNVSSDSDIALLARQRGVRIVPRTCTEGSLSHSLDDDRVNAYRGNAQPEQTLADVDLILEVSRSSGVINRQALSSLRRRAR